MAQQAAGHGGSQLRPLVPKRYVRADTTRALEHRAAHKVTGKVVITP